MAHESNNRLLRLPDELLVNIFAAAGPIDTARCATTCEKLRSVSEKSSELWREFAAQEFFHCASSGKKTLDWKSVYVYLLSQLRISGYSHEDPLPARVVFADDGSHYPGHPPENALREGWTRPYSTGVGVYEDVDLVIDLSEVCLITGFAIANHCHHCTGPVKEALVFASMQPPDLDYARRYDSKAGSEWVSKLEGQVEDMGSYLQHRKTNRVGFVKFTPGNSAQPLAGFRFPDFPECNNVRLIRDCKSMVGRYVHFKLLSTFDPFNEGTRQTICVMHLHTFGVALSELPALLQNDKLNEGCPIPDYERIHELSTHRVPTDGPGVYDDDSDDDDEDTTDFSGSDNDDDDNEDADFFGSDRVSNSSA